MTGREVVFLLAVGSVFLGIPVALYVWRARDGQTFLERMLAQYGRTFWLAFFAGTSSFLLSAAAMWATARTAPETGRIISEIAADYLFAAFGFVLTYAGKNLGVEMAHTRKTQAPRQSGAVPDQGSI